MLLLSLLYSAWFCTSLMVSVPVVNVFLLASAVDAITAPFNPVFLPTVISKPPTPAYTPLCSLTDLKVLSTLALLRLTVADTVLPIQMGGIQILAEKPPLLCLLV